MGLKVGNEYKCITEHGIRMNESLEYERMLGSFATSLQKILGISADMDTKDLFELLKNEHVLKGHINGTVNMDWYRHEASGKCLNIAHSPVGPRRELLLSVYDIETWN